MGPLAGVRVLEFEAIGPGPFCGMMLADMGADVLLVDRPSDPGLGLDRERWFDVMLRGRRSVTLDLKSRDGAEAALLLAAKADAVIEGFRPGVMERLGLGPRGLLARNPRLVYGRMTGWGQDGPLAPRAGHDINYIALSGVAARDRARRTSAPVPPLNLVGDFGGGGMLLAFGIACALLEAQRSGQGQVVDARDGRRRIAARRRCSRACSPPVGGAKRAATTCSTRARRGTTPTRRADGSYVAIGAIEPKFYAELLERLGLAGEALPAQHDRERLARAARAVQRAAFRAKTRDEWAHVFEGSDACFAPVLTFSEAQAASAQRRARRPRRGRRRRPAGAGAALRAHPGRSPARAARARRARAGGARATGASRAREIDRLAALGVGFAE